MLPVGCRPFVASLHTQVISLRTLIRRPNMLSQEIEHPLSPTSPFEDPTTILEDPFRDPDIPFQALLSPAEKLNGISPCKLRCVLVLVNIS
jgi:hypothetical protein